LERTNRSYNQRNVTMDIILHATVKDCLDELVLDLQKMAYTEAKEWKKDRGKNVTHYKTARAYLDAVQEINRKFGTNYAVSILKVEKHFDEPVGPARDLNNCKCY